ncbi:hypothetical protein H6P81_021063 [Aristolochia fimbriata]|uniref:Uncharacterized protein n=1 Tax=Aristolochia fimbriata TaxID=158543 RepID=A0AAV7E0G2_ARIFI|nr:hypothetical protein H6P81_021063 [Aristolochia fimbriata]
MDTESKAAGPTSMNILGRSASHHLGLAVSGLGVPIPAAVAVCPSNFLFRWDNASNGCCVYTSYQGANIFYVPYPLPAENNASEGLGVSRASHGRIS